MEEAPKQFCSNCGNPADYNPRYPKYICKDCRKLEILDENGIKISFSNVSLSGGLLVYYHFNDINVKKEECIEKICFIGGKKFAATESRFGGIVIQKNR